MLKKIPKSDISIRPFKVYKEWEFNNVSTELDVLEAENLDVFSTEQSSGNNLSFNKVSLYGQLRAQFYKDSGDNPFTRFGSKTNQYVEEFENWERYLNNEAKVISIPQRYIGEGIKKRSVLLNERGVEYIDDGYGNLFRSSGLVIYISEYNLQSGSLSFTDSLSNVYSASIDSYTIDLNTDILTLQYDGTEYQIDIAGVDLQSGEATALMIPFVTSYGTGSQTGNVFYEQGLVVFTKNVGTMLLMDWELKFKSTETIYENEYLLVVGQDEFNVSTNPTSFVEVGKTEIDWLTSDNSNPNFKPYTIKAQTTPGVKYIRKLGKNEFGQTIDYRYQSKVSSSVYGGFEQIDISGSTDVTGSFLTPFITTIGLYDDDCQLIAVAKLPQPIKSLPNIDINFIIRIDT
jgi:hypothetical protein